MEPYRHILEQHVDDAAFLWVLRSVATSQPHYTADDLQELEIRIEKHLDGILMSLAHAWPLCLQTGEFQEGGEAFVLAVTAFRSLETDKIKCAVDLGDCNEQTFEGLASALAWLPGNLCHEWMKKFFVSKELWHKRLALAACGLRLEDPADYLNRILEREDCRAYSPLYCQALRSVGEFKRQDLLSALDQALVTDEESAVYWALRSKVLLGDRTAALQLEHFVFSDNPHRDQALQLAFRVLPLETARAWISKLGAAGGDPKQVIKASAALGDPQAIGWLVQQMRNPELARVAGEAFSLMTGIDLERRHLALDVPDITEFQRAEEDSPVGLDEEEHLPWPDVEKVAAIWQKYGAAFVPGNRYFLGKPVEINHLKQALGTAYQRQRQAAALELALLDPAQPLINLAACRSRAG